MTCHIANGNSNGLLRLSGAVIMQVQGLPNNLHQWMFKNGLLQILFLPDKASL